MEVRADQINLNFRSVEHHVVGNGMRFDATDRIRMDERWRMLLSESQLAVFNKIAGDKNGSLGYV
jgi:hypothetical protein